MTVEQINSNLDLEPIKYLNEEGVECVEEFRNILTHEGYQVSDLGRVKSLGRLARCKNKYSNKVFYLQKKDRIMKLSMSGKGYRKVILYKNDIPKQITVHILVCLYFHDNLKNKRCVNHKNSVRHDNRKYNLEWCTHSENNKHGYIFGKRGNVKGENSTNVKLTESKVLAIRRLHRINPNFHRTNVARKLGLNLNAISPIIYRRTWKHI